MEDLILSVLNARRRERDRTAKALHDEIGQLLTATGLELDLLRMDAPAPFAVRIATAQHSLEKVFGAVRRLTNESQAEPVTRFGLAPAFGRLADLFRRRFHGEWKIDAGAPADFPHEQANALYDIAELALDNVERHSKASRAWLLLTSHLEIGDDGTGFDPETARRGFGLTAIPVIAARASLRFSLDTSPGRGTIIQVDRIG